jgi:hypothetical protein
MISISEGYSENDSKRTIELESIGVTVELTKNDSGNIQADVLYGDIDNSSELSKGIVNGILLALTALLTCGYDEVLLDDPDKLSEALESAITRVPNLVSALNQVSDG